MFEMADYMYLLDGSITENEWNASEISLLVNEEACAGYYADSGNYFAEIVSNDEETLYLQYFSLDEYHPPLDWEDPQETDPLYTYRFCLPARDNIGAIYLKKTATAEVVHEYQFEQEKTPGISLVEQPPAILKAPFLLRWDATNVDGRNITYKIYYSYDNGAIGTWVGVRGLQEPERSINIGTNGLRASTTKSMFRVFASDGVNYSYDTSEPFLVGEKAPVVLSSPPAASRGEVLFSVGHGYIDGWFLQLRGVDGERIPKDNIAWYSDVDGFVGRGTSYYGNNLTPGEHEISVQVTSLSGTIYPPQHITYVTVVGKPEILVTVGDGTNNNLACNEIEIDVDFKQGEIARVSYGFNLERGDKFTVVEDGDALPIRYQMEESTSVRVNAVNNFHSPTDYKKYIELEDCDE